MTPLLAAVLTSVVPIGDAGAAAAPAERQATKASKGKVLLVASSTNAMQLKGGRTVHTGYILAELAAPAQRLIAEGYDVEVATPQGSTPATHAVSVDVTMFDNDPAKMQQAMVFALMHPTIQRPLKLRDVVANGLSQYAAVYIAGGHSPMSDLQDAGGRPR